MNDTIFALSTVFGRSGVAVFRISGSNAKYAFQIFGVKNFPQERVAFVNKIYNSDGMLLDECLIIYFTGPRSFTGEDVVELQIHGSVAVIKAVSNELSKHFRQATPGEFSLRSFLNGKMTLSEVESLADLMNAETLKQIEFATKLKESSSFYKKIHSDLISLRAFSESCIDFSEHVDEEYLISELKVKLNNLINVLSSLLGTTGVAEKVSNGIYIALLGAPNTGKSTLLNYIAKRDVAIISSTPGTTRDIIEVNMDLYGYPVTIADTAGLRDSSDEIESEGIKRSLVRAKNSDINIVLLEYNQPVDNLISNIITENTLCFISKCDSFYSESAMKITENIYAYTLSAHAELGMDRFFLLIKERVENLLHETAPYMIRERHLGYIQEAVKLLESIDMRDSIELISENIIQACNIFKKITGDIVSEDILDEIFKRFCIGK